jgi:hypothetical protein
MCSYKHCGHGFTRKLSEELFTTATLVVQCVLQVQHRVKFLWVKTNLLESVSAATARALDFNVFSIANGIQLFGVR